MVVRPDGWAHADEATLQRLRTNLQASSKRELTKVGVSYTAVQHTSFANFLMRWQPQLAGLLGVREVRVNITTSTHWTPEEVAYSKWRRTRP